MTTEILFSFITLSLLEIVLGIDNLIFIALISDALPAEHRKKARLIGLSLALIIRIIMLSGLSWIMQLTEPFFSVFDHAVSVKDLLLLAGGLFLLAKATLEMHADIKQIEHQRKAKASKNTLKNAIFQIVIIDFVFSFDSIITAVGLTQNIPVMAAAVVVSMIVMMCASGYISEFLRKYPTFKMLALSFILMIGMVLVAEGMHIEIPKAYIYFAFGFSIGVEALNSLARRNMKHKADK